MLIEKYTSPHSGLVVAQAQRFPALLHGHMDMELAKKRQNCAGLIHSVLSNPSMSHPLSSWLFSPQSYFTLLLTSKMQSIFLLLISFQFGSATQTSIPV